MAAGIFAGRPAGAGAGSGNGAPADASSVAGHRASDERPPTPLVIEPAPAKLNLYLHVVGRRSDGYHLLDSLVVFASVADWVSLTPAEAFSLTVEGPFADSVPAGDGNLALAAAVRLAAESAAGPARIAAGVAIALTKNLPVAAGLGGGSADAAAVLRALVRLWADGVSTAAEPYATALAALAALPALAESLGADVPVCLAGQPRFVGGIGEQLDPAPLVTGVPVVLVNPGIPLATPSVFRARAGEFSAPARFAAPTGAGPLAPWALAALLAERRNDLTAPALDLCPAVGTVLAALAATPGCMLARMSGSGATCFGLYDRPDSAEAAAMHLAQAEPGWWVRSGQLL